jgi:hypothetical protein
MYVGLSDWIIEPSEGGDQVPLQSFHQLVQSTVESIIIIIITIPRHIATTLKPRQESPQRVFK